VTTDRFIATAPTPEAVPAGAASRPAGVAEGDADGDMCRTCGACCSYSADWPRFSLESESHLARIPAEFIDAGGAGMRCDGRRCAALAGVVGRSTSCAIYPLRPDVCHACVPGDGACREARAHFGL
jgi:uncharacterized protein